jgi:integrase
VSPSPPGGGIGQRIHEALALAEADLDARRGSLLVRRGKGGRRREVGMDDWAWEQLAPWLKARVQLPVGLLFCVVNGPPGGGRGRPPRRARSCGAWLGTPVCGGASRRISCATPTPSRWRASVPLIVIQRQLGHTNYSPVDKRPGPAA